MRTVLKHWTKSYSPRMLESRRPKILSIETVWKSRFWRLLKIYLDINHCKVSFIIGQLLKKRGDPILSTFLDFYVQIANHNKYCGTKWGRYSIIVLLFWKVNTYRSDIFRYTNKFVKDRFIFNLFIFKTKIETTLNTAPMKMRVGRTYFWMIGIHVCTQWASETSTSVLVSLASIEGSIVDPFRSRLGKSSSLCMSSFELFILEIKLANSADFVEGPFAAFKRTETEYFWRERYPRFNFQKQWKELQSFLAISQKVIQKLVNNSKETNSTKWIFYFKLLFGASIWQKWCVWRRPVAYKHMK